MTFVGLSFRLLTTLFIELKNQLPIPNYRFYHSILEYLTCVLIVLIVTNSLFPVTDYNSKKRSKKSTPTKSLTSLNSHNNSIPTPPPILSTSGIPASTPSPTDTAALQHSLMAGNFAESDGHSSDSERKRKKARTTFTGRQIFELEKQFELKKYLSSSERSEMAKMLGVTETQVRPKCLY